MSKERLEEIKTRFNAMKELESFKKLAPTDLFFDDLNWLLQQAERVEKLEKENTELHREIVKHASQVFDIANASFETGERAKQLINKMVLKGESQ